MAREAVGLKKPSQQMLIWLACRELADVGGLTKFSAEEISVAAWARNASVFGLKGFDEYPDNRKVVSSMSGKSGMVARGHLVKVGDNLYSLGNSPAEGGRNGRDKSVTDGMAKKRAARFIGRLLATAACFKMKGSINDPKNGLTKLDAMNFFGCNKLSDLDEKVCRDSVKEIQDAGLHDYAADADVRFLLNVGGTLMDRFLKPSTESTKRVK